MAGPSTFQTIVAIANGILSIAATVLLLAILVGGFIAWRAARRAVVAARVQLTPIISSLSAAARDLEGMTGKLRGQVDAISDTVGEATDSARALLRGAEGRLKRLDYTIGAAQDEVEDALTDIAALARGLRAGAGALRGFWRAARDYDDLGDAGEDEDEELARRERGRSVEADDDEPRHAPHARARRARD